MNGSAAKTWSLTAVAISLVCLMASCGGGDLFRQGDWTWGEPQWLPPTINSDLLEYCPMGTPEGRYLIVKELGSGGMASPGRYGR